MNWSASGVRAKRVRLWVAVSATAALLQAPYVSADVDSGSAAARCSVGDIVSAGVYERAPRVLALRLCCHQRVGTRPGLVVESPTGQVTAACGAESAPGTCCFQVNSDQGAVLPAACCLHM